MAMMRLKRSKNSSYPPNGRIQVQQMKYGHHIRYRIEGMTAANRIGDECSATLDRAGVIVYIAGIPTSSCQTE